MMIAPAFEANIENVYLASGSGHPELAEQIADHLRTELGPMDLRRFPNTERYVRYRDSVRRSHTVIIQSFPSDRPDFDIDNACMELNFMVWAARKSSAGEITVVVPKMPYDRQDRMAKGREAVGVAAVMEMFEAMGADRLVTVDMHSPQSQVAFRGPFDHLTAIDLIGDAFERRVQGNRGNFAVVSPDSGRIPVAEHIAEVLGGVRLVNMPKKRDPKDSSKIIRPKRIGGVKGRMCLVPDDLIDTGGTQVSGMGTLENSDATGAIIAATHAHFSADALEKLQNTPFIKGIIVTDTLPIGRAQAALGDRLEVLPSAPLIGEAILRIVTGDSVSGMFGGRNHR